MLWKQPATLLFTCWEEGKVKILGYFNSYSFKGSFKISSVVLLLPLGQHPFNGELLFFPRPSFPPSLPHPSLLGSIWPFHQYVSPEVPPAPLTGSAVPCGGAAAEPDRTSQNRFVPLRLGLASSRRAPPCSLLLPAPCHLHPMHGQRLKLFDKINHFWYFDNIWEALACSLIFWCQVLCTWTLPQQLKMAGNGL